MDSARIDIAYRPMRVAWVTQSNDFQSFRKIVRLSHTIWGGRFNPIVFADRPREARDLIDVFQVDMVVPEGPSSEVAEFAAAFPHLPTPYYSEGIFIGNGENARASLLDIQNALHFLRENHKLEELERAEFNTFSWDPSDPLADFLLIQLGAFPAVGDCPIDYGAIFAEYVRSVQVEIHASEPLPTEIDGHPSIAYLSRVNLQRQWRIRNRWEAPGFFVGDVTNLDDLVTFWNLRATDNHVLFIDPGNLTRFGDLMPIVERRMLDSVAHLDKGERQLAVWARSENLENVQKLFEGRPLSFRRVSQHSWNGLNIMPPVMIFGEASTLGVFSNSSGRPTVSFSLADKPFHADNSFRTQHLVASVSIIGAGTGNERHTFLPPYAPEMNRFLGRSMPPEGRDIRIEPERLGIVIDAAANDAFIKGLSTEDWMVELFKQAGVSAKPSAAGLVARQLITQLGGVDGGRVFKIPGVRRLIKMHGPTNSFTRNVALNTIGSADPSRPAAKFSDHKRLFIEPRTEPHLTPSMVFAYLISKGLFRMGADLICPTCSLQGWTALDSLKTKIVCEYCGAEFDATLQLVANEWRYRRSGLLGRERNVHGAIPVVLTLQQLHTNLHSTRSLYLPSYELEGLPGTKFEKCEVDFLMLSARGNKADIIIGECKDRGEAAIDATTIENFKRVGALIPDGRFEVYYLLSKLGSFSADEIALAATLNDEYHRRAILLTADELEPYRVYERATDEVAKRRTGASAEDLALITAHLYFPAKKV